MKVRDERMLKVVIPVAVLLLGALGAIAMIRARPRVQTAARVPLPPLVRVMTAHQGDVLTFFHPSRLDNFKRKHIDHRFLKAGNDIRYLGLVTVRVGLNVSIYGRLYATEAEIEIRFG